MSEIHPEELIYEKYYLEKKGDTSKDDKCSECQNMCRCVCCLCLLVSDYTEDLIKKFFSCF
jgi:hypothetical protein